jgi:uncharacterized protein (DUF2267 family)
MDYERFIATVERRAHVGREEAERATAAVLESLADRLNRDEVRDLQERLPLELAAHLPAPHHTPEAIDLDEFLLRVARRAGVDVGTAEHYARAVFAALREAIGHDEMDDLLATLPEAFAVLLTGRSVMPVDVFLARVSERTGLDRDGARRATAAVLEALAERIPKGEIEDLIGRLPVQLHEDLRRGAARNPEGRARRMSAEEFVRHVADREGVGSDDVVRHVRAVFETLREAVSVDEFSDITVELPPDFAPLLPRA